jgi:hypothetical protein
VLRNRRQECNQVQRRWRHGTRGYRQVCVTEKSLKYSVFIFVCMDISCVDRVRAIEYTVICTACLLCFNRSVRRFVSYAHVSRSLRAFSSFVWADAKSSVADGFDSLACSVLQSTCSIRLEKSLRQLHERSFCLYGTFCLVHCTCAC